MTTAIRVPNIVAAACVLHICACSKPAGNIIDENVLETSGGDGLFAPHVDLPGTDTGGDEPTPVLLPTGQCMQIPNEYVYGYTHQCSGSIRVSFDASGHLGEDAFEFGPGASNPDYWLEPDSYEKPLVAACCGPFNYLPEDDGITTEEKLPYVTNCLFDAVQQICHGLPYFLRKQAAETSNLIARDTINSLADAVEQGNSECIKNLYGAGAPGPNGTLTNQLDGTSWSPTNNATFTIEETWIDGWTREGDVTWDTCYGIFDNDDAVIPTAPFQSPGTVAVADATLMPGTTMTGTGPAWSSATIVPSSGTLRIGHMANGGAQIDGLRLHAENSTASVDGEEGTRKTWAKAARWPGSPP